MKKNIQFKGQLKLYMQWPAIMLILLLGMNLWIYKIDRKAGFVMSAFILIYAVVVGILYTYNKSLILTELIEFSAQYGALQNVMMKELPVPYVILLDDGRVIWKNDKFSKLMSGRKEMYLNKYIQELNRGVFPSDVNENTILEVEYENGWYEVELSKISARDFNEAEMLVEIPKGKEYLITACFRDITELKRYVQENEEQRMVSGLIYIDNYEEVMDSVEEVRQSLLAALIERKVNQYISNMDGIVKKMEKDKYFVVIRKSFFEEMKTDRFSILEEVKSIDIGNNIPATLSIGLGLSNDTYAQSYNYARVSIDLALARGGDQVVVKSCDGIDYYGGKKEQTSKNTRVKARVKAEALREFITAKDRVIIMGHKIADVDSFGAAIGIYRAVKELGKEAHIVINEITASVRPLYEAFNQDPDYPANMFLNSKKVEDYVDNNTMVVVVDTNRPGLTECEELLKWCKMIVVLDHHRQASDAIEGAVLSYIEPYASSTCEMVAEVMQYIVDDVKLQTMEANSLYAGIMIDTNNFMNRSGVRTFEAAAFLKRCGADITYVRKLFREDMDTYRAKASIISSAEVYRDVYAIAKGVEDKIESPTIIGAQAANELLDIGSVKASFVLTRYNGKIYVSARSIDEVNVQIIMERLGGGGHINTAGAQFDHTDMEKAIDILKETISVMIEEGDI